MVNIFRSKRKKSVIAAIIGIFSVITIIMFLAYGLSYYIKNLTTQEYESFMLNNNNLSSLPIIIDSCEYNFTQYLKNRKDTDYLKIYYSQSKEIQQRVSAVDITKGNYNENLIFMRSLSNMNEYQQTLVKKIIMFESPNAEQYLETQSLKTLFEEMKKQSQLFLISYLNASSLEHAALLKKTRNLDFMIHFSMICLSVIIIGIGIALLRGILNKIKQISKAAFLLSDACWDIPDIQSDKYLELNSVAFAFNKMKNNIKSYIEELEKKSKLEIQLNEEKLINERKSRLLKESELETLQMQMNPHFLFNTLNMIKRVIQLSDKFIAVDLIDSISNILRYNMDNRKKMVRLTDEINVIRSYTLIQQTRFQERINIELNTSGNLSEFFIPPLILQPIVENAIVHGLKDKSSDGLVKINVNCKEDSVNIIVEDNGVGFTKEKLDSILNTKDEEDSKGIGILNVRNRLALQFGTNFFFNIESEDKKGTRVIIDICYG